MTAWRKASACGASNTCVEVAEGDTAVLVRDSADTAGPVLALTPAAWTALLDTIKERR
ncbi:DUF397 domain-containing protein [Actinomadura madurae]|uniref:DUF397 domain-containing protein n=1 Tax=Actinomadura madurae TaxID=1993 RepID=UPI0020D1FA38|nr:DUF397 domain-containing protein [Actinomadura madurae]MCP9947217.1 DUF397 domain-containing protein [Actinomadura madurae]MCP9963982.1 DUF397 domain-containing protein [Actinomadura madurae]MCP9976457.1 DUF397 domain-containing protein [Actinomadura madurae]MCQ0012050.1 DUF397 domain-containing protein [Actinomadura madurae]MCQ0012650.1 DUF397 domain-containing protein [Actinomadura madurae]